MIVRTMAVGLVASAYLVLRYFEAFFSGVDLSPGALSLRAAGWGDAAINCVCSGYVIGCLGAGFAVAGVCWPLIERCVAWLFSFSPNPRLSQWQKKEEFTIIRAKDRGSF
jgi:hypothetical protein